MSGNETWLKAPLAQVELVKYRLFLDKLTVESRQLATYTQQFVVSTIPNF